MTLVLTSRRTLMSEYVPESAEEEEFLANYDPSKYAITIVTVDVIIRRGSCEDEKVVLVKRGGFPYRGRWALPGGFMEPGETGAEAAAREVMEEANMELMYLDFLTVADTPDRDPRGRCVSMVFVAGAADTEPFAGDDAVEARWFLLSEAKQMDLAFDHNELLEELEW